VQSLVESHADPLIFAPDDVAGNLRAVGLEEEVELVVTGPPNGSVKADA
jgi:hypothetical protein